MYVLGCSGSDANHKKIGSHFRITPQEENNFPPALADNEEKLTPEQENNVLPSLMGQGKKSSLHENILQLIHNLQNFRKGNKTRLDANEKLCNSLRYLGNEVAQILSCKRSKQMMLHSMNGSNPQTWVHIVKPRTGTSIRTTQRVAKAATSFLEQSNAGRETYAPSEINSKVGRILNSEGIFHIYVVVLFSFPLQRIK
jgi:hypothetical protein